MIVTIHQPEHLIWLGLIDKIRQSDVFVILDDVQFEKNNFQNRNKIKSGWLTVPIKKHKLNTKINEIEIADTNWRPKYLKTIKQDYSKAPNLDKHYPKIEAIINKGHKRLLDLNVDLICYFMDCFGLRTKIMLSSPLNIEASGGSERCAKICQRLGAETYLAGSGSLDYLKRDDFGDIKVLFHQYEAPNHLSALDYLFNV